ncbi:MAG: glycine betaine ABC transporter substrate-binding protein [Pseudomonadales bacterium]|jgi:osmoprotectant transport system permease protein|nr:glycine betaine ABC transporter substrate-binding protein [Pseudomonadales bacterium]
MRSGRWLLRVLCFGVLVGAVRGAAAEAIVVGSKNFPEGRLLGEIVAQTLEGAGYEVERRLGLGGTLICYEALVSGEIDVYVEYTGTITEAILAEPHAAERDALTAPLAALGLRTLPELGFDNTYALALAGELARAEQIVALSDLARLSDVRAAFSHEFIERSDGWRGLRQAYGLSFVPRGIDNALAYRAIESGQLDLTDANSTDGELQRYDVRVLEDDRAFFPRYAALPLVRADFPAGAEDALAVLAGRIDAARMRSLNARVVVEGADFGATAATFLAEAGIATASGATGDLRSALVRNTVDHLRLTAIALSLACLVGLPLGILVHRSRRLASTVLYTAGLLQTIPSIALLALMIPVFGIGWAPAVVALFLYSLLPILRNTVTALLSVDPLLRRVAAGMGLTTSQQVRWLLLPMALPTILAGVRTAAVISIGTATLAAFVGAGGLGEPIVTGLSLNDPRLILQGAIPAALLALGTELAFELLERRLVPAALRRDPLA